ncbi:MAG: tol-pal system protein YbgF [Acidobacteriota bacterium]
MSRVRRWLPSVLAVLALAGCATGGATPEAGADVLALQSRVLELQRKAAVTEVELARLRQQVAALEARQGSAALSPPPAAMAPALVPARPQAAKPIEEQDLEPAIAPASSPAAQVQPTALAAQISAEGQAAYDEAYALFHQGRYVDAESAFQRFLQSNPRTDLTDNAFYWIGESRFARGDLRGALAAFRQTIESYPSGNKVPDALLKAGQCLQALGDADGAKASFEEIVRRFPEAAAAVVARERLDAMP